MNNVIPFPKKEQEMLPVYPETVNTDMIDDDSYGYIGKELVKKPKTSGEYLLLCKKFLIKEDYESILCSIMDIEYYHDLDNKLKGVVSAYYSYISI
jgi:hypothetical protein